MRTSIETQLRNNAGLPAHRLIRAGEQVPATTHSADSALVRPRMVRAALQSALTGCAGFVLVSVEKAA